MEKNSGAHVPKAASVRKVGDPDKVALSFQSIQPVSTTPFYQTTFGQSENQLNAFLRYCPLGVVMVDKQNRIKDVNDKFTTMLGYSRAELLDLSITDITYEGDQAATIEAADNIGNGLVDSVTLEKRYRKKNGELVFARTTGNLVLDTSGMPVLKIAMVQDISKEKELERKRQEEFLFHQKIEKTSPNLIFVFDLTQHKCIYLNDFIVKITGYSQVEIEDFASPIHEKLVHPDDLKIVVNFFELLTKATDDQAIEAEYRILHKEEDWRWLKTRASVFKRDEEGNVIQILGSAIDISYGKNIELALIKSESKFRALAMHSPTGVFLSDAKGGNVYINDKLGELMGAPIEATLGGDWTQCIYPEDRKKIFSRWQESVAGEVPFSEEIRWLHSDGKIVPTLTLATPIADDKGQVSSFVGTVIDLRSRIKTEEAIAKQKELERINRELEQFAYIASHDLQEPLRTIISFTDLLEKSQQDKLSESATKQMHFISEASARMSALIDGILNYSRLGNKREISTVDCNALVGSVLEDLGSAISASNAVISAEGLPTITAAQPEMRLLFQNLIGNAVKFAREGVIPEISISALQSEPGWLFSIKDNGIGIDEKYRNRIFIIFQRLHNRSEFEGTGIGLAHCKRVVDLHGGEIWVESTVGQGSTFNFFLPV